MSVPSLLPSVRNASTTSNSNTIGRSDPESTKPTPVIDIRACNDSETQADSIIEEKIIRNHVTLIPEVTRGARCQPNDMML
jgi:hypothetical protein